MNSKKLLFISPALTGYYPQCQLDNTDQQRLKKTPALSTRPEWQTARIGKHIARQFFPQQFFCLTHKADHSLLALGNNKPGIDLEYLQPRNFSALGKRVLRNEEQHHLKFSSQPLIDFYRLWTIKEALIKAEDLTFPTDMTTIGFYWQNGEQKLKTTQHRPNQWLCATINRHWIFSSIWFEDNPIDTIEIYRQNPLILSDVITNIPTLILKQQSLQVLIDTGKSLN